ncbi:MAG TPA: MmgE/PrpD family protein [Rhizobium sp.]
MKGDRTRGQQLGAFIADSTNRELPAAVVREARRSLLDYLGVALAGAHEPSTAAVRAAAARWNARGRSRQILGDHTSPALAALVNGTMAHALDYDDIHYQGAGHPGGPCWSTALAVASHYGCSEREALSAFVTGFEVMTRIGGGDLKGVGRTLQRQGFHPTAIAGRAGAAATAAALLRLDAGQAENALGAAATMFGGLLGSFGTHGKPFHAGKAAMDGVLAAELAAEGFVSAHHLYELQGGWLDAFLPGKAVTVPELDFGKTWELLRNGYKLCASCGATHAPAQAAYEMHAVIAGRDVVAVHARVHDSVLVTAGKPYPATALEGKFSTVYCIALGLNGYRLLPEDFSQVRINDPAIRSLASRITLVPETSFGLQTVELEVELIDGTVLREKRQVAKGNPQSPLSDDDLEAKFDALVSAAIGSDHARQLHDAALSFGEAGTLNAIDTLLETPDIEAAETIRLHHH